MKNLENFSIRRLTGFIRNENLRELIRYWLLFTMLLVSIASLALHGILTRENNPFFYANF